MMDLPKNTAELGNGVHVWPVELAAPTECVSDCFLILSPDERERANRFHFAHHRRAFILGRGLLRRLLARYIAVAPADIALVYASRGKPAIAHPSSQLRFNISHSGNCALYALSMECEVGVDVEEIRPIPDLEAIAQRFFCEAECADLLAIPEPQRTEAFFRCWTRKEAYIKAVGDGLSLPLNHFRVTVGRTEAARFVHLGGDQSQARAWALHHLDPAPGYVGALAFMDAHRSVLTWPCMSAAEIILTLEQLMR